MSSHIWVEKDPQLDSSPSGAGALSIGGNSFPTHECSLCKLHRWEYSDKDLENVPVNLRESRRYAYRISIGTSHTEPEWVYDREPTCSEMFMYGVME